MFKRIVAICIAALFAVTGIAIHGRSAQDQADSCGTVGEVIERYINAVGGRPAIEKCTTRVYTGYIVNDVDWEKPPFEVVPLEVYSAVPNRTVWVERKTSGVARSGFDGSTEWRLNADGLEVGSGGPRTKMAWTVNPQAPLNILEYFPGLEYKGVTTLGDKQYCTLESPELDRTYYALYFEVDTGLLTRIGYHWYLEDYREVDGVLIPHRISAGRKGGKNTFWFDEITHNLPLDSSVFQIPDSAR
ncbi:MAG: hypothetical protein KKA42_14115 [candidate division Zixibacteria bacterium]|nr:hypothetical protein [candidate division Zixibacteria bacterium]